MVSRPTLDTLESLRITLEKLEHSMQDATAMAELKRAILLRIAELETADVLRTDDAA
jgi:hypothetical protein